MQQIDLKARGLYSHPNPLSEVPAGAMLTADNVVIDREGITQARRGVRRYGTQLANTPNVIAEYNDRLIIKHGNTLSRDSDGAGTWVNYSGTYASPTGIRMKWALANKNFYFTSNTGLFKLDSLTSTPALAGMYSGLDGDGTTTGASGFLSNNANVAYRVVFGITDVNNNKIVGAPSQRFIVGNNSGGTRDVNVTFTLPTGMTTSHFYQVYRSGQTTTLSTEPNDELQLVIERNPTAGEITAGTVTYTDSTPDSLRGATLYTSPSQEGIEQANDQPPLSNDIALYKNHLFYFNTTTKHRLNITIISIGSPNGLQLNDTINIAGTTYTAKAAETIASGEFELFTGGTLAENIDDTARSLIRVVNRYASNTAVYAKYLTGFSDLPGKILIEERGIGGSQFYATTSRTTAFSPEIPTSGTTYGSSNDVEPNAIYISKPQQPEAVPILQKIYAGAANKPILRGIALRDSVFVLKQDGIYRITGETINDFRVELFDNTTTLTAIESAVPFNNQVYCISEQGETAISDSGVAIVSRPIENTLFQLSAEQYTAFPTATWGAAYESDRKYLMGTVSETTDTYATQIYIYNAVTQTFTRWPLVMNCGYVAAYDNKLYMGSADPLNKYIYQERKSFTLLDYADDQLSVTISSSTGTTVVLTSTTGINPGDTLAQFSGGNLVRSSVIVSVDSGTDITVEDSLGWMAGAAIVYMPINSVVKYTPVHAGNPAMVKLFSDFVMFFTDSRFTSINVAFTSDQSIGSEDFDVIPTSGGSWGLFPWGGVPWGGGLPPVQVIRTLIPSEKARCHWYNVTLTHNQALSSFGLAGISSFFDEVSEIQK